MKVLLFTTTLTLVVMFQADCQVYYDFVSPPTFSKVSRNAYFKYFGDRQKLIFLDYKEGLSLPCDKVSRNNTQSNGDEPSIPYLLGKNWHLINDFTDEGLDLYYPEEQNSENWREMISIQRIDGQGQSSKKLYMILLKMREERCPGMTKSEIVEDTKKYTIYKSTSKKCGEFEPQSELSMILTPPKLLIGQYTLWKVEYVVRNSDQEVTFTEDILNWFRGIELLTGKELGEYLESN